MAPMLESLGWDAEICATSLAEALALDGEFIDDNEAHLEKLNDMTFNSLDRALNKAAEGEPRVIGDFGLYLNLKDDYRRSWDDPSSITVFAGLAPGVGLRLEVGIRDPWMVSESEVEELVAPILRTGGVALLAVRFRQYSTDGDYMEFTMKFPGSWVIGRALSLIELMGQIVGPGKADPRSPIGALVLLLSGRPEGLLGQPESSFLEVKERGYGFQNDNQKHEYAMDLAALANTEKGALLIVGMKTTKSDAGQDIISAIPGCSTGSLSIDAYGQVARQRVVPPVEGLEMHLVEYSGRHILVIYIPPQPSYIKPFLVKGGTTMEGRTSGASFTIPTRMGDARWNMSAEAVHSLLVAARVALSKSDDSS